MKIHTRFQTPNHNNDNINLAILIFLLIELRFLDINRFFLFYDAGANQRNGD
jgi:hypothetical protein